MLHKLEGLTFSLAMMPAVTLEGAVVYWLSGHSLARANPDGSPKVVCEWAGFAVPQGWLLGAFLVLVYHLTAMLVPPKCWTDSELVHNRRAFIRLRCVAMAPVAMQGLPFLFPNMSAAS